MKRESMRFSMILLGILVAPSGCVPAAPHARRDAPNSVADRVVSDAEWTVELNAPAEVTGGSFGIGVSNGGDLNGDGYDDLAVGAHNDPAGVICVFPGSSSGARAPYETCVTAAGDEQPNHFYVPAIVGDVDGDSFDDLVVGARFDIIGDGTVGAAYLFPGGPKGVDEADQIRFSSQQPVNSFGSAVFDAGDLNGDGLHEIAVTDDCSAASPASKCEGRVSIFFGHSGGVDFSSELFLFPDCHGLLSAFGTHLAWGDVDGDGLTDVVGGDDDCGDSSGVFTWYGDSDGVRDAEPDELARIAELDEDVTGFAAGDANGDGYSDAMMGNTYWGDWHRGIDVWVPGSSAGLAAADYVTVEPVGLEDGDYLGFVASAGDMDGDGFDDFALRGLSTLPSAFADAWVVPGSAVGPAADESVPYRSTDGGTATSIGWSMSMSGDLDGDGLLDLVMGEMTADAGKGQVYEYFGCPNADNDDACARTDCDDSNPDVGSELLSTYADADGDGHGDPSVPEESCPGAAGVAAVGDDCDDADPSRSPTAVEIVGDGVDEDCDGVELCYSDRDGDGWVSGDRAPVSSLDWDCADPGEASAAEPNGDCDDEAADAFPGALETCGDDRDLNCDGSLPLPCDTGGAGPEPRSKSAGCNCGGTGPRAPSAVGWFGVAAVIVLRRSPTLPPAKGVPDLKRGLFVAR